MTVATSSQLKEVSFRCAHCRHKFQREPGRIEDFPEQLGHPYRYFADCPECGEESEQVAWQKATMASIGKHTGPKTAAGLAASAANLEGHPTPEEALRTRFNAVQHALFAETATFFPAKPGRYPHCERCEHLETRACFDTEVKACIKRTELLLQHQIAFETGDPGMLTGIRARTHAMIQAIIDDIILAIISTGVQLETPVWYYDKDGGFHFAGEKDDEGVKQLIYEVKAHPLLKSLTDFISKNNMTLADMQMTPKQVTQDESMQGYLDQKGGQEQSMLQHQERQSKMLDQLGDQIARSQSRIKSDPVLIEHGQEGQSG